MLLSSPNTAKVEKFIKRRASHVNFLRSGWLPAIKKLDFWNRKGDINFVKKFAPKKPVGIKQLGKDKGNVIPAIVNDNGRATGLISNSVGQGKQDSSTVHPILQAGLKEAIALEIKSMRIYVERKFKEKLDKVNKGRT